MLMADALLYIVKSPFFFLFSHYTLADIMIFIKVVIIENSFFTIAELSGSSSPADSA